MKYIPMVSSYGTHIESLQNVYLKISYMMGIERELAVKKGDCSSRGLGFAFLHSPTQGNSQSRGFSNLSVLHGHYTCMCCTDTYSKKYL